MNDQMNTAQLEARLRKKYYIRLIAAKVTDTLLFTVTAVFLLWNIEYRSHTPVFTRISEAMSIDNLVSVMFSRNSLIVTGSFATLNVLIILFRILRLKKLRSEERKPMKVKPAELPRDVSVVTPVIAPILISTVVICALIYFLSFLTIKISDFLSYLTSSTVGHLSWKIDLVFVFLTVILIKVLFHCIFIFGEIFRGDFRHDRELACCNCKRITGVVTVNSEVLRTFNRNYTIDDGYDLETTEINTHSYRSGLFGLGRETNVDVHTRTTHSSTVYRNLKHEERRETAYCPLCYQRFEGTGVVRESIKGKKGENVCTTVKDDTHSYRL